ncbi:hypothetical protein [Campylobacter troglodytis]|uniref:hypothetical protein n=1 Tax=Campylobacter troglodytis TaxID=654363 RepID=UPI00115A68D7|nr:hypothetical protein [Campylobacter troglodytis]TQR61262.1 hypothetical protein DMC01_02270 [Campylobacter troglodytis]
MILCAFLLFGGFLWLFGGLIRLFADKKFTEFGFVNEKKVKFKGENSKITELKKENSSKAEFQAKNSHQHRHSKTCESKSWRLGHSGFYLAKMSDEPLGEVKSIKNSQSLEFKGKFQNENSQNAEFKELIREETSQGVEFKESTSSKAEFQAQNSQQNRHCETCESKSWRLGHSGFCVAKILYKLLCKVKSIKNSQSLEFKGKFQNENSQNAEFQAQNSQQSCHCETCESKSWRLGHSGFCVAKIRYEPLGEVKSIKNSQNLKLKYTLTLIFTALCLVPFYQGFNLATLMYSFFDAPSVICVLLMDFFVLKTLAKDFLNSALCKDFKSLTPLEKFANLSISPLSFVFLLVYGSIIFLGNLDLIPYDFYTLNALTQPYLSDLLLHEFNKIVLVFALLISLYATSKLCAILALSSLLPFVLGVEQSMLTTLICPYLWLFSLIMSLKMCCARLFK